MAINRQSLYAFLALIFLILSVALFYLFYLSRSKPATLVTSPPSFITVTPIATIAVTSSPSASPSPVVSIDDTLPQTPNLVTTPSSLIFKSDEDNFSVSYSPLRTLYQDKFASASRYTFYSPAGSFAIHVGSNWSWLHPDRQFNSNLIVAGQNTFVYNINLQTIIDIDRGDRKYTIQCIHNAKDDLKNDCTKFTNSFKFLN